MQERNFRLYQLIKDKIIGFKGLAAVKKIEEVTDGLFSRDPEFLRERTILGSGDGTIKKVVRAAVESNFEASKNFPKIFIRYI